MKFWRPLLSILSGLLLALCFAPFEQTWLVWAVFFFFFPAIWSLPEKKRGRRGFGLAYLTGLAFWLVNVKWIGTVAGPMGVIAISAYLALYFATFGYFAAKWANPWINPPANPQTRSFANRLREMRHSLSHAAILGFAWCGLEWIRGWMITGFSWNGLGVAFYDSLMIAQAAEWVGVTGLAFLPVFTSAVFVQVIRRFWQQRGDGVRLLQWDFAIALCLLASTLVIGTWRMSSLRTTDLTEVRVLLVQQNIPQFASHVAWETPEVYNGYEELTLQALEEIREEGIKKLSANPPSTTSDEEGQVSILPQPDWIVWPEASIMEWIPVTSDGQRGFGQLTRLLFEAIHTESAATIIAGGYEMEAQEEGDYLVPTPKGQVWNSLMSVEPDGKIQAYYKKHLVLFGETLPDIKPLKWLYQVASGVEYVGSFSPGQSIDPVKLTTRGKDISVIPSICFEDTVARVTRRFVRPEAQAIVNITNDGWFLESEAAVQHFQNARFRAIELRRPMLRCSNTGVSGVISFTGSTVDPYTGQNRVLVDANGSHFTRDWLFSSMWVPNRPVTTLYALYGDWFSVTGLVLSFLWFAVFRFQRRSRAVANPS